MFLFELTLDLQQISQEQDRFSFHFQMLDVNQSRASVKPWMWSDTEAGDCQLLLEELFVSDRVNHIAALLTLAAAHTVAQFHV